MTHEQYAKGAEIWQEYEFDSERTLKNVFAVSDNVDVIIEYARVRGERCNFRTFTFADVSDENQCVKDWGTFLRRLRAKTGVCGLRVFEWGRTTGRLHVHAVFDRWVSKAVVDELRAGTTLGHVKISREAVDGNAARYLYKEVVKQFRRNRGRRRLWATFGRLAAFCGVKDYTLEYRLKNCRRYAWETREQGESRQETERRAASLYVNTEFGEVVRGEEAEREARKAAEKARLTECRRRAREMAGRGESEQEIERRSWELYADKSFGTWPDRGDAYEDGGGSVEFEPSELGS
jgi:hypothetical protein